MSIKDNMYKAMKETATKRLRALPEAVLAEEARRLDSDLQRAISEAARTIRPVRVFLSFDAFILLQVTDKLILRGEERPLYKGLICHPAVFPNCDINPFQFHVYG